MTTYDPVLLTLIRHLTPQVIANSIIGVQSMAGATGSIFSMRPKYFKWKFELVDKLYFKSFLRLNDKRSFFSEDTLIKANYPVINLTRDQIGNRDAISEWCNTTIGKYSWISNGYDVIAFSNEQYATLFKLTWD